MVRLPQPPQQWQASTNIAAIVAGKAESCASMADLKRIHAYALRTHLHQHPVVLGKMFRFAAVSPGGDLFYAHRLFSQIHQPTTFFYNILIRGYSNSSSPSHSILLFNQMRQSCVTPDEYTFNFLLKSRSRIKLNDPPLSLASDEIHGAVLKFGFLSHLFVDNALIHLYAVRGIPLLARRVFEETVGVDVVSWSGLLVAYLRAGELEVARRVFDEMPERDVVTWTAMISGYSKAKCSREALDLFWDMTHAGVGPDEVTMVSVISACTKGDVEIGRMIHQYIYENGFGWMVSLCNALIDMYAKCGCMEEAWLVFNNMNRKSLVTWNTMITASANHGNAEDALNLFEWMRISSVVPDSVTFLALLVAYTHKGLVDEGVRMFESMQRDYGIEARIEHYGCVVDMLGRAGRLEEAYNLLTNMPIPCNDVVWGALLGACRIYGDVDMGEKVIKLLELKPDEGGYYILLRDIYNAAGRTMEAHGMREAMFASGATKNPGCSWVEASSV